jgi:cytochrome c-type biogenesis protein CcmH
MTLFVLLSVALAAATIALLAWRRPVAAHVTDPATAAVAAARPSRGLVISIAVLLAGVAAGGYALVGTPQMLPVTPDAPPGPGPAADAQLEMLQQRAQKNPSDAAAWVLAARAQLEMRDEGEAQKVHQAEALADYRHALALRPNDADLLADTADLLAVAANGRLEGEPMQLVERALAADPNHVKALALKGSFAMTQRDFRTALQSWDHAMRVAPPGDPIAAFLRQQLESMRAMAARAAAASSPVPAR